MDEFLNRNSKLLVYLLTGLILIGFGVLLYKTDIFTDGDKVEVLDSATVSDSGPFDTNKVIVVEISGAVLKPGVYKLPSDSRIDDLLIISGGLSVDASREWVDKNINRASKLVDGQKLYVYQTDELTAKDDRGIKLDQPILGDQTSNSSNLININTSSQSEIEKLNGIGPVYAQNIIEHRPYSIKEELVSRGAISQKIFEKIKNEISL